jgi:hypothetical protein
MMLVCIYIYIYTVLQNLAIEWINTDIRDRVVINNQKVNPSNKAGLQIEINSINVKCSDSGEYKCSISGNSGSDKIWHGNYNYLSFFHRKLNFIYLPVYSI